MRLVLLVIVSVICAPAASPVREAWTGAIVAPGLKIPAFRHGYVVEFQPANGPATGFTAYASNGSLALSKAIELPEASDFQVTDVDFDSGGAIAVGIAARTSTGHLNRILLLDRAGKQTGFVDTGRFLPNHVTIAPDGSIWALGWQWASDGSERRDHQDYMIVRQYSTEGKEVKAMLPRSSFTNELEPGGAGDGARIAATADRIGMMVFSGHTSIAREWIELDKNGKILYRSRIDDVVQYPSSFAFTADDHIYLQGGGRGPLYTLDAESQTWKPVSNQGEALMGEDGVRLVYGSGCCGALRLQWFDRP